MLNKFNFLNYSKHEKSSFTYGKILSHLISRGVRPLALKIIISIIFYLKFNYGSSFFIINHAVSKMSPTISSRKKKIKNRIYQLPKFLIASKEQKLATSWLIYKVTKKPETKNLLTTRIISFYDAKIDEKNNLKEFYEWMYNSRPFLHLIKYSKHAN